MPRLHLMAIVPALSMVLGIGAGPASAEKFRSTVIVAKPAATGSTMAANRTIDAAAQRALAEAFITERLSPVFLARRGDQVRVALEPLQTLLGPVNVVSRTPVEGDQVSVICEADVDAAGIVLRLVENGMLSYGQDRPRLLLLPSGTRRDDAVKSNDSSETLRALRVRVSDAVRSTGITLLSDETVPADARNTAGSTDERARMMKFAVDTNAHFIALTTVSSTRAPSPAGVVLDVVVQYTLLRPSNAAIIGEDIFTGRGSGSSAEMALGRVLNEVAPAFAKSLAGALALDVFQHNRVVDPELPVEGCHDQRDGAAERGRDVDVARPAPGARLRDVAGKGRVAHGAGVPADRLVVRGKVTVDELFHVLAKARFGEKNALRASIFEHGAEHLGIEILDSTAKPKLPQAVIVYTPAPAAAPAPPPQPAPQPAGPPTKKPPEPPPVPSPAETPGKVLRAHGGVKPLELDFNVAYLNATRGPETRREE